MSHWKGNFANRCGFGVHSRSCLFGLMGCLLVKPQSVRSVQEPDLPDLSVYYLEGVTQILKGQGKTK